MLVRGADAVARGLLDASVQPSRFVTAQTSVYSLSRLQRTKQIAKLVGVWLVNLALYAVPLTLSGIGFTSDETAPAGFEQAVGAVANADAVWQFLVGLGTNSAYLTVFSGLIFVTFHAAVLAVGNSRGYLQSLHTVVYTTSVYLAGLFTVVMYASTAAGLDRTREVLVRLQSNVIVGILDVLGIDVTVALVRPGPVVLEGISRTGELLLGLLVVLSAYFLYSLYLGARINHDMGRLRSSVVLVAVALAPVAYVAISVAVSLFLDALGGQVI